MDFTLKIYQSLLSALRRAGYTFRTFEEFLSVPADGKVVILRHDIDKRPENALRLAQIEHASGVKASYYIRVVKGTWNEEIIEQIVALGHEMSYHYEDLTITKGNYEKAFEHFKVHLAEIRRFYPAKTVCMHGSPLSRWDNRKLWEKYNYREAGIIGEPYFDVDYTKVLYITDTGRAWNKTGASVRDKVEGGLELKVKNTRRLITLIGNDELPEKLIINTHPQQLSLQEIFNVAQTYEQGSEEFNHAFQVAALMFPNDPTANLNAAAMEIQRGGDLTIAKKYLTKADANEGATQNNLGVIALIEGDLDTAQQYFTRAKEAGVSEAEANLQEVAKQRNFPVE